MKDRLFLTVGIIVVTMLPVLAQPGDPGGNPDVPIGGLEILLSAGGLLGLMKMLKQNNTGVLKK